MTVTNMKAPPAMVALQTLLAPEDPSSQDLVLSLSNKISTATSALMSFPTLHPLALEVISSGILYQCSHVDMSSGAQPSQLDGGKLTGALREVWGLLDKLLEHCPLGWSMRFFKWCLSLLARLTTISPSPPNLDDALRMWLTSPVLAPVIELLDKCTNNLVSSGCGEECMEVLFPVCSQHSSNLDWLLAHFVSLHPLDFTALLLNHALSSTPASDLSFSTLTKVFEHLSHTHCTALQRCVVQRVRGLVRSGEGGVEEEEEGKGGRFEMFCVLLQIATRCQALLDVVAEDVLKIVTADKLKALVVQESGGNPSAKSSDDITMGEEPDQDEGEILSDEEEAEKVGGADDVSGSGKSGKSVDVVPLLSELICRLPGKEACSAVCLTLDLYQETRQFLQEQESSMEEGEIVRESGMERVLSCCRSIMREVLSRLHSATCTLHLGPGEGGKGGGAGGGASGQDLGFAVGIQQGMKVWCDRLLQQVQQDQTGDECIGWLQELIMCLCISSSELQAARALARLLCHSHLLSQLHTILDIFTTVQSRHCYLTRSTVQCALTSIQQLPLTTSSQSPAHKGVATNGKMESKNSSTPLFNFVCNMIKILKGLGREDKPSLEHMRQQFHLSLHEQLLPLTQLLAFALPSVTTSRELLVTFDLLQLVVDPDSAPSLTRVAREEACVKPQSRNRMLQALLAHHFSLLRMLAGALEQGGHTHLNVEAALGKSLRLITWCTLTPATPPGPSPRSSPGRKEKEEGVADSSARVMALAIIMEALVSKEMEECFSPSHTSNPSNTSPVGVALAGAELLSTNLRVGLSRSGGHSVAGVGEKGRGLAAGRPQQAKQKDTSLSTPHLCSHVTQLLLAVGPSPSTPSANSFQRELGVVLLDAVAPQSLGELKQWPEEETLKYSLERDLAIKHMFDVNPILWECLRLISSSSPHTSGPSPHTSGLVTCAPIVRSLLTVLTQHWQRCCTESTAMFPKEVRSSVALVDCMAKAGWLVPPLAYIGELFPKLTSHEIALLLGTVNTNLKQNYVHIKTAKTSEMKDAGITQLLKGILVKNIHNFGHLYSRFLSTSNS